MQQTQRNYAGRDGTTNDKDGRRSKMISRKTQGFSVFPACS